MINLQQDFVKIQATDVILEDHGLLCSSLHPSRADEIYQLRGDLSGILIRPSTIPQLD